MPEKSPDFPSTYIRPFEYSNWPSVLLARGLPPFARALRAPLPSSLAGSSSVGGVPVPSVLLALFLLAVAGGARVGALSGRVIDRTQIAIE